MLTLAQYRVAVMMSQGMSDREIAAANDVSLSCVRNHLKHAFSQLGFSNSGAERTQRIRLAVWCASHRFQSIDSFLAYQEIAPYVKHFEEIFCLASKPIKFPSPSRRRRSDREMPAKAA